MKRTATALSLVFALALAAPAFAEAYDAEGGVDWLGEDNAGIEANDAAWNDMRDTMWYGDEDDEGVFGFAGGDAWQEDDYGIYDSSYDYDTDDGWFTDWYGDAGEAFDD